MAGKPRDFRLKVGSIKNIEVLMEEIEVGDRFRQSMGDIEGLAMSITKDGLIQPISISKNPEKSEKPYRLIAGGRRYRALEFIKSRDQIERITCRLFERELTDLELRTLEFAENLYRKDLSWQEECNLKSHIMTLQQKTYGERTSTAKNAPGYSLTDLSKLTGKSKGSLSEDINLAKMMSNIPEVDWSKFKKKEDAKKALKGAKKKIVQTTQAAIAIKSLGTGPSLQKKLIDSYHIMNFFEGIKNIGDSTMDIVELDPPYAIKLEEQKKDYGYTGYNEIDPETYPEFMMNVYRECFRVLKPNSWIINWFGPEPWFNPIHLWLEEAGFKNKRMPGLWVKGAEDEDGIVKSAPGQTRQPERDLAKGYEMFFYARKGVPLLAKPGSSNVFGFKPIPPHLKTHPTERPIEMISEVLRTFAQPNANVLVPFAGSGNTLLAAAQNQMIPVGFDLTQEFKDAYVIKVYKMF